MQCAQVASNLATLYYYSEPAFLQCTQFEAIETAALHSIGYNGSVAFVGMNEVHTDDNTINLTPDVVDVSTNKTGA